ncbi:AraC family transcriptional regulator [Ktedonospora formicarum]|uniref:AraC family transcriptional regulator n=2 Tax=Ktedonospora formicarum TaxID=2778364 RepID=A0A8J3HX37_9CHLR|nr:AraC family transcriptional regulator [Ktedonospora formicarum]
MSISHIVRLSDSPLVEEVKHGRTERAATTIRPAECCWHLVLIRYNGGAELRIVGPLTIATPLSYPEGAELLWIKFRLGAFMPRLPLKSFLDTEKSLPDATSQSFWLDGSTWQYPSYENADTFVEWLVRKEILVSDPVVKAALQGQPQEVADRTLRHRFLRATGLTQKQIQQFQRAQLAWTLLQQGVSILDTVEEAGYFDQPHLTRALKHWLGHTPAQIVRMEKTAVIL